MKNLRNLLIILTAALFLTACEKKETSDLLNISGEVLIEDAITPAITTPLEGITVYLLNSPFSVDTISWWVTKTDILDSTQTDNNGLYKFKHLQAGNYVVLPNDPIINYQFDWSASPDSNTISVENTQTDYTINFTAPEVIAENSPSAFTFEFNNINFSNRYNIIVSRKERHRILWWSDWDWDIDGELISPAEKNLYTAKHTNTYFKEYKDWFLFSFSLLTGSGTGIWMPQNVGYYEIESADLKAVNKFNVVWNGGNGVTVTPVE